MKRQFIAFAVIMIAIAALMGCSSGKQADIEAADVQAVLTTKPEQIQAGDPVELRVAFSGIEVTNEASVTFDFRTEEKPKMVNASFEGDGTFAGEFTFPEKGEYAMYIHLYADGIHVTKKKMVDVQ